VKLKMKLGALLASLDRVSKTVDKKGEAGSTCILMDANEKAQAVYLYSTNMVAEVYDKVSCEVETAGKSLIDPGQLRGCLAYRNSEDELEIAFVTSGKGKTEVNRLCVTIGKDRFHLGYDLTGTDMLARRVEAVPTKTAASYTMSGRAMSACVRRGGFCIPDLGEAQNRFEMSGMHVVLTDDGYEAHATDGHIATRIRVKGEQGLKAMSGVLIPGKALSPLSGLIGGEDEIQVIEGPRKQFYRIGKNTFFGTRLLEGRFPDVAAILAAHAPDFWIQVNREQVHRTLQRAGSLIASVKGLRQVELEVRANSVIIRAKGLIVDLTEELPADNLDMPADLVVVRTINLDYLLNIATTSSQEQLKLGVSENERRAIVVDDVDGDVESRYAMMPVSNQVAAPKATATKVTA